MGKILLGKEPAEEVLSDIRTCIKKLGRKPKLAIVLVGENPASELYVSKKLEKAMEAGIDAVAHRLSADTTQKKLEKLVKKLNKDKNIDGFIIQTPLPKHIDEKKIVEMVDQAKDVDGWTSVSAGRLLFGMKERFEPATPAGVMKIFDFYNVSFEGRHAVVVGRSNTVGKPMAALLLERNATVTLCHSKTTNLTEHTKKADILVVAVGKPGLITADMIKDNAYIIDVGTTHVENKLKGDVDFENVIKKAHCSPVPGGVGPMTVAMLLYNVTKAAERNG